MSSEENVKIFSKNQISQQQIIHPKIHSSFENGTWILANELSKKPINSSNQLLSSIHLYSVPLLANETLLTATVPSLLSNSIFERILNTDYEAFCKSLTDIVETKSTYDLLTSHHIHSLEETPIIRLYKNKKPKENYITITVTPISKQVLRVISKNPFILYQLSPATVNKFLNQINQYIEGAEFDDSELKSHPTTFLFGVEYDKYAQDSYIGIGILHMVHSQVYASTSIFRHQAKNFIQNHPCDHIIQFRNL